MSSAAQEIERRRLDPVRIKARKAYEYLFYGIDEDDFCDTFMQFHKEDVVKANPQLRVILSEGEPTVIPLLTGATHGVDEEPNHGGPIGYKIFLISRQPRKGGEKIGDGVKFTVYHQGSAFIERAMYRVLSSRNVAIADRVFVVERPLAISDLPSLEGILRQVQLIYRTTNPYRYDYLRQSFGLPTL